MSNRVLDHSLHRLGNLGERLGGMFDRDDGRRGGGHGYTTLSVPMTVAVIEFAALASPERKSVESIFRPSGK